MVNLKKLKSFCNLCGGTTNLRIGSRFLTEFYDDGSLGKHRFDCLRHNFANPLDVISAIVPIDKIKNELKWAVSSIQPGGWITTAVFADCLFGHNKSLKE